MGGIIKFVDESVEIQDLGPEEFTAEVLKLDQPWIGDEGPLAASFWQHVGGELPRPLHFRGLAFDSETTVQWDEDLVQVIRPKLAKDHVIARKGDVLIREKINEKKTRLATVMRIDYLSHGVLLASRYLPGRFREEAGDA